MAVIAGVDEAGRGSVLGPLLVAGVSIDEKLVPELVALGVKDSKLLTSSKRKELYGEIRKISTKIVWESIEPSRIDKVVFKGTRLFRLNYLEAQYMARVLSKLRFDLAYLDCCDTIEDRFGNLVSDKLYELKKFRSKAKIKLGEENPIRRMVVSKHHADSSYAIVSAASIVAKVKRDACIANLRRTHGNLGSGYPSDPVTTSFLEGFVRKSESLPSFTRLSWSTVRDLYKAQTVRSEKLESYKSNSS